MAEQTGIIEYRGSFKSIRHYRVAHDKRTLAGEKGGANINLIMHSPVFARTRENMSEFKGCGVAVKEIHRGLLAIFSEYTDTRFMGRLVAIVKKINVRDPQGKRGRRAILISLNRAILKSMNLHEKRKMDNQLKRFVTTSHPESRAEATITVNGLNPDPSFFPSSAQFYRVINHLSIISDFAYSESNLKYEALNPLDTMNTIAYSDYTPVNTTLTVSVKAAFSDGIVLGENVSVLQCVGIEFYTLSGGVEYLPYSSGSMLVYDVF